jgi:hypothetical protein
MLKLNEDRQKKAIARISIRISRVYGLDHTSLVFIASVIEAELAKESDQSI